MATGSDPMLPSKEKTNFLRLTALVIDGGTLALKTQFDAKFPPLNLGQDLQAHGNVQVLSGLKNKRILTQAQFSLLFPPPPKNTDSTDFDVCLFSCLIQNLPAFQQQNSPVWKQLGPPAPTDFTLAADVKRLRYLRNFVRILRYKGNRCTSKWDDSGSICLPVPFRVHRTHTSLLEKERLFLPKKKFFTF